MVNGKYKNKFKFILILIITLEIILGFLLIHNLLPNLSLGISGQLSKLNVIGIVPGDFPVEFIENSNNSILYKELKSNFSQKYNGVQEKLNTTTTIKINWDGFRDREFLIPKSNVTYRIIILGDSVAFGLGVEANETYSKILENLLNSQRNGINYEVLNFGVPGYNTLQEVEMFKQKGLKYELDLIIIGYHVNDFQDQYEHTKLLEEKRKEYNIVVDSLTKAQKIKLASDFETYYLFNYLFSKPASELWERIAKPLSDLNEMTKASKTKVVILTGTELLWDQQSLYLLNMSVTNFNSLTKEYNWQVFDMHHLLSHYSRNSLIVGKVDGHMNQLGHKIVGEKLYEFLLENNITMTSNKFS